MVFWPFRHSRAREDALRLLDTVTAASRRAALFGTEGFPDSLAGRFEAMTLNGALALVRLRADRGAAPLAQAFTDMLFRHFDAGLREAGVGDMTVPKRMRVLAGNFYGRLDAYAAALSGPVSDLTAALTRNTGVSGAFAARLAAHVQATARQQASADVEAVLVPSGWPEFPG